MIETSLGYIYVKIMKRKAVLAEMGRTAFLFLCLIRIILYSSLAH